MNRNPLAALAVAFVALLTITGCGPRKASRPPCPAGQVCLQIGNTTEPVSLDPHKITGTWESRIVGDLVVGLTQDAPDGSTIPAMATSWETTPDGLVWTFHLRDAQWSDGVPVTADDFVFALQRIMDPQTASEYASLLYFIKNAQPISAGKMPRTAIGARAIDAHTLELTLEHPAPYLPELAKHQTMAPVPKHVVEKWGDAWSQPGHYVSNGAYVPTVWRLGDYIRLEKNPRYWDAAKVCATQVNYYPISDAISAERRVLRGELDATTDILSNRIAFLKQKAPGYPRVHTYLGVSYAAFNRHVPGLDNPKVRSALSMAIDRDFITQKLLRGGQVSAYTFTPPGLANYTTVNPPEWTKWSLEKRQAEARRLLAEAGFGPSHPLKIEIKLRNSPDPTLYYPAIQADWKSIGVDAKLVQVETQIAYSDFRTRNFQVADAAWIADYNDALSFLYLMQSKTGSQNYGDYDSPAYDDLLAKADNEPDAGKRAAFLAQAERIMLDDASVAPIYFYVNKNLVNPKVTGWVDNLVDHHFARDLCVPH